MPEPKQTPEQAEEKRRALELQALSEEYFAFLRSPFLERVIANAAEKVTASERLILDNANNPALLPYANRQRDHYRPLADRSYFREVYEDAAAEIKRLSEFRLGLADESLDTVRGVADVPGGSRIAARLSAVGAGDAEED